MIVQFLIPSCSFFSKLGFPGEILSFITLSFRDIVLLGTLAG
jgi:hypothetical protein